MTHKNREQGSDEYATPPSLWRPLSRAVDGFDVDPASGVESTPIAETRYTREDNGLSRAWHGDVWLNPPFGDAPSTGTSQRETWLEKARQEARRDAVRSVTVLLPVDTSTRWFHTHVVDAPVLCLMGPGRMEFEGEKPEETGNTSFATCIAVYGDPPDSLVASLEEFGAVFRGREYHRQTTQQTLVTDGGTSDTGVAQSEGETRMVNGERVVRKENAYGAMKDHVRVNIGTNVLEVPRRLKNPITDRREDLTKLSDDGYLKPFLAFRCARMGPDVVDLSDSPVLTFDDDRWEYREVDGQHVLVKREAESKLDEMVLGGNDAD